MKRASTTTVMKPQTLNVLPSTVTPQDMVRMYVSEWETHLNGLLKTAQDSLKTVNDKIKVVKDNVTKFHEAKVKQIYATVRGTADVRISVDNFKVAINFDTKKVDYNCNMKITVHGATSTEYISRCMDVNEMIEFDTLKELSIEQTNLVNEISKVRSELSTLASKERLVSAELTRRALADAGTELDDGGIKKLLGLN